MPRTIPHYASAIASVLLIACFSAVALSRPRPKDAEPFHQRIRELRDLIPMRVGDWKGTDIELTPAATKLLRPNTQLMRRYVNPEGRAADLLLVQCRDARDMVGHYPPVCYPSQGWTRVPGRALGWRIGDQVVPGVEYAFTRDAEGRTTACVVSSLIILPDGRYVTKMKDVEQASCDYNKQYYGAAQIQVVLDAAIPAAEREAIVSELLQPNLPLLEALRTGGMR